MKYSQFLMLLSKRKEYYWNLIKICNRKASCSLAVFDKEVVEVVDHVPAVNGLQTFNQVSNGGFARRFLAPKKIK